VGDETASGQHSHISGCAVVIFIIKDGLVERHEGDFEVQPASILQPAPSARFWD